MSMIAVLINDSEETCSWQHNGIVALFQKSNEKWIKVKSIPYLIPLDEYDLNLIRDYYLHLLSELDDCKIFVAKKLSGFLINLLDYNKLNIYELNGNPVDFLNSVYISEERKKEQKLFLESQVIDLFAPRKMDELGNYKLDLYKLLHSDSKVTSKQIIIPFLKEQTIRNLEVVCDHIPKWFDRLLKEMGFTYLISSQKDGLITVNISPVL
jgi:Fe-only nitrogenase accessory protein AnfO